MNRMRHILIASLALCVLTAPAAAQDQPTAPALLRQQDVGDDVLPPNGVFRNFIWGVGMDDVREFEPANTMEEHNNELVFIEKPDEYSRLITYSFIKGKLRRARYEYVELHDPDTQKVMNRFLDTQIMLTAQFGAPKSEEMLWGDDLYRYYPQFWNRALRSGNVRFRVTWETAGTRVVLQTYRQDEYYQLFYTLEDMSVSGVPGNDNYLKLLPDDPKPGTEP